MHPRRQDREKGIHQAEWAHRGSVSAALARVWDTSGGFCSFCHLHGKDLGVTPDTILYRFSVRRELIWVCSFKCSKAFCTDDE